MLNRINEANALDFQAQALTLRSERQRLIASNIANADTPGYQARDMDFAKALQAATGTLVGARRRGDAEQAEQHEAGPTEQAQEPPCERIGGDARERREQDDRQHGVTLEPALRPRGAEMAGKAVPVPAYVRRGAQDNAFTPQTRRAPARCHCSDARPRCSTESTTRSTSRPRR